MTYLAVSIPFLLLALACNLWRARQLAAARPGTASSRQAVRGHARTTGLVIAALLVLTAIFDNAMIAAGLVTYGQEHRLGLQLGLVPIEDFFYPLVVGLLLPAFWSPGAASSQLQERVSVVLHSSRPLSWVNTAFPFGAAYLLTYGRADAVLWIGVLFFLIPYNVAMYGINDVFDYESDIRNPRKGGVEGAVLPRKYHRLVLWSAVASVAPFACYLYAVGTWTSAAWLSLALAAVYAYSAPYLRFKERPVLDSVTSSLHFVTPALVGATIGGGAFPRGFAVALTAFFLWGMASHALGAVQDIEADRAGGLSSIATFLGAQTTVRLAVLAYAAASGLVFLLPGAAWVVGVVSLAYAINAAQFWSITDERSFAAHRAWKAFLLLNFITGAAVTMTLIWEAL